ncbi:class I SAM-dependent DNA methyltransferase [Microbacterium sp. M]|uniref:HsdM family class I SAM-dependent methyltransferase n=1 Tax=Microbacterium sp. M TaxID=3377125 RepID=UPI0038699398
MTVQAILDDLIATLGYRDSRGYVDESVDPGVRSMVWNDLQQKCGVDAAFFKGAVPVVAFVAAESRDDALQAHRRLWNYGRVPVLIATTSNEVLALSCNTAQTSGSPGAALLAEAHHGEAIATVFADFTRFSVESGRLAQHRGKQLDAHNRVDHLLLRNLHAVRSQLLAAGVYEQEIEPLLGRSIFVRYLEDRHILEPQDLRELGQPESLEAALANGWNAVSTLFDVMADHFNGDVFRRDVLTRALPDEAMRVLAGFFHGADPATGQVPLWDFDFAIIPPELISSIYEQLLAPQQKDDAAYYTPRRIVDLVLDELLPSFTETSTPTVLDPACGSGIFLTETFRRLVHQHRTITQRTPNYDELSTMLKESVFGIDRNADAIGVTAFGLYLALLEHVDPRTIWRTVKLPNLVGTNLIVSDFFETNMLSEHKFDVIVGNPPWKSELTPAARKYLKDSQRETPDQQIAVPFIWKASEMLSSGGVAGLVLPSKTVLHNGGGSADRFRLSFFRELDVQTVIDLSPLRMELFGATSPAVVVVFGADVGSADEQLLHVSPRRTPISEIIDGIAIPQQNIRRISRLRAQMNPSIWKTLLWGGPQDVDLVSYLRETFETLDTQANTRRWRMGAGYQLAKTRDKNDASHLHDLPTLATKSLVAMAAPDEGSLGAPLTAPVMHRPRERAIYLAPHVLMRKGFSKTPMAAFIPYDAVFTDGLFALAGPYEDASRLRAVSAVLNSSVATYWYLMTSSSWGVEREQLHKQEWLSLPIPDLSFQVETKLSELVESAAGDAWRDALNRIVEEEVYKLTAGERQLITDALTIRLSELQEGPKARAYDEPDEVAFATYVGALKRSMDDLELGEWNVHLAEASGGFARMTCEHSESIDSPGPDSRFTVHSLLKDSAVLDEALSSATIVEPQAVILDENRVHIIKPNRRANWMVSSAPVDAADVFDALLRSEHARMRDGRA